MTAAEDRIKLHLDGTFTRLQYDGRIVTEFVELDFIPTHRPKPVGRESGKTGKYRAWVPDDDTWLNELRNKGIPRHQIAEIMGRSEESVRRRIERNKRLGRLAAVSR
jgi:hypothetical protein